MRRLCLPVGGDVVALLNLFEVARILAAFLHFSQGTILELLCLLLLQCSYLIDFFLGQFDVEEHGRDSHLRPPDLDLVRVQRLATLNCLLHAEQDIPLFLQQPCLVSLVSLFPQSFLFVSFLLRFFGLFFFLLPLSDLLLSLFLTDDLVADILVAPIVVARDLGNDHLRRLSRLIFVILRLSRVRGQRDRRGRGRGATDLLMLLVLLLGSFFASDLLESWSDD